MGQQLFDTAVEVGGQAGEHVTQVGPGIEAIELGRPCRPPNYAERPRFSLDSPRAAFDPVGIV
jgi:hypothetical protein